MKWEKVKLNVTLRTKSQKALQVLDQMITFKIRMNRFFNTTFYGFHLTHIDVTLDECANNPRKIELRKVRLHLKDIGKIIESSNILLLSV